MLFLFLIINFRMQNIIMFRAGPMSKTNINACCRTYYFCMSQYITMKSSEPNDHIDEITHLTSFLLVSYPVSFLFENLNSMF